MAKYFGGLEDLAGIFLAGGCFRWKGFEDWFSFGRFFLVDFSGSSEGTKPAGRWPKLLCQERLWGDFFLFQTNLFLNWWNGTRWFGSWGIPLEALLFLGYTPRIRKPPAQNHLFGNSCFHFQTFFFCLVGTGTPRFSLESILMCHYLTEVDVIAYDGVLSAVEKAGQGWITCEKPAGPSVKTQPNRLQVMQVAFEFKHFGDGLVT